MIKHEIIVHKETVRTFLPTTTHNNYGYNPYKKNVTSQESLDALINSVGWDVGDLICYNQAEIKTLTSVHKVVDICKEYDKLLFTSHTLQAQPFKLLQLKSKEQTQHPWVRWDNSVGYRFLTQHEVNTIVKPHLDFIQDYCEWVLGQTTTKT